MFVQTGADSQETANEAINGKDEQTRGRVARWLIWGTFFLGSVALLGLRGWGMWRQQAGLFLRVRHSDSTL